MQQDRPWRVVWIAALVLAALLLAACSAINPAQSFAGGAPYGGTLGGTVTLRTREALPAGARIVVQLVDRSSQDLPVLAEQTLVTQGGQPPYAFLLTYDATGINPENRYGLIARVFDGETVAYSTSQPAPVLTFGAREDRVDLSLQQGEVQMTAATPGVLHGRVVYAGDASLPAESEVVIELVDRSQSPLQVVATQRVEVAGAGPAFDFVLNYDPNAINGSDVYGLAARLLVDGLVRYVAVQQLPVLTGGSPADNVEIVLQTADEAAAADAATARGAVVSGVVDLGITDLAPAGTVIEVEIVDTAQPERLFARQEIRAGGLANPVPFEVPLVNEVRASSTYTINARVLVDGVQIYKQRPALPVLADGAPTIGIYIDASKPPPPPLSGVITGTVTYSAPIPLGIDAYGVIELYYEQDGVPVMTAQQLFFPEAAPPPYDVALYYPVDVIDRSVPYTFTARILVGDMEWFKGSGAPVLYGEEPVMSGVTIRLQPTPELLAQRAAEAAYATEVAATATAAAAPSVAVAAEATPDAAESGAAPPAEAGAAESGAAAPPVETGVVESGMAATPLQEGEFLPVVGTLTLPADVLPAGEALPAGTVAEVQVLDVATTPFTVVAEQTQDVGGAQPPLPFAVDVPVDSETDLGAFALGATLRVDGVARWRAPGLTPLLGEDGPRTDFAVELEAVPPADASAPAGTDAQGEAPDTTSSADSTPPAAATPTASAEPTVEPTAEPTPEPTPEPTAEPTAEPTEVPTPEPTVTPAPVQAFVTGAVQANNPDRLPAGALVTVQLRKGAAAAAEVLDEVQIEVDEAGGPVEFALEYDASAVDTGAAYSVGVRITRNGTPLWITGRGFPVITNGAPTTLEVEVD